jgi:hypothetical protein
MEFQTMSRKLVQLGFCLVALAMSAAAQVTGSGSANQIPVFTGTSTVSGNSNIASVNGNVGIGTTSPGELLEIGSGWGGNLRVTGDLFGINIDSAGAWSYSNWLYRASWSSTYNDMVYLAPSGNHSATSDPAFILSSNQGFLFGTGTSAGTGLTSQLMRITTAGNVGIGTTSPAYALDVVGQMHASSGVVYPDGTQQTTAWTGVLCGGDYAEAVDASGNRKRYEPGDVLTLSAGDDGEVERATEPYSTLVAGIYASKPGAIGRRQTLSESASELPMAMVGIVPTKVTTENGPIHKGDLLVTSSQMGYAMKGTDRSRMLGAVLGKAMGSLDAGTGVIEVLVTLQ